MRKVSFVITFIMASLIVSTEVLAQKNRDKESSQIKIPKAKDYSFKAVPKDSLEVEEEVMIYGDGFSWQEKYPDNRRYRDPWKDFRNEYQGFAEKISKEIEAFKFNEAFNINGGFNVVNVYPNQPDTHILNVRLTSSNTADPVVISIVDVNGELIVRRVIEDFDREFIGQIDVGIDTHGILFVLISQGENAISRKVNI